jgi:hypothetical protein
MVCSRLMRALLLGPMPLVGVFVRLHEEGHWLVAKILGVACDRPVIRRYETETAIGWRGFVRVHPQRVKSIHAAMIFLGGPLVDFSALMGWGLMFRWGMQTSSWIAVLSAYMFWIRACNFGWRENEDLQRFCRAFRHWRSHRGFTEFQDAPGD